MTMLEIIQQKYPDAKAEDYQIIQDGTALKVEQWSVRDNGAFTPRPSAEELRGWIDEIEQAQLKSRKRSKMLERKTGMITRSAVGKTWGQLSRAEKDRLFYADLQARGAFDATGRLKPTAEWTQKEELL